MMTAALIAGALLLKKADEKERVAGMGIIPITPPLTGQWPFQGFPEQVSLNGSNFVRARWAWPLYSGVHAQYRAAVPTNSMHLFVYADGSFLCDHMDEISPEYDPIGHAVVDAPAATTAVLASLGFAAGLVGGIFFWKS
jgi:hypothetical protein